MASQSAAKADIFHVCIIYLRFHFRPAAIDVSNRFPGRTKQIKVTRVKLEHLSVRVRVFKRHISWCAKWVFFSDKTKIAKFKVQEAPLATIDCHCDNRCVYMDASMSVLIGS